MASAFKLLPKLSRQDPDTIVNGAGTLQIYVRSLKHGLKQLPGFIYLYGDDKGKPVVFEIGIAGALEAEAAAAIKWYAREWLFHPAMDLSPSLPEHFLN